MSEYFDKDFFKLSLGFLMIVSMSVLAIFTARVYESREVAEAASYSNISN